MLLFALVLRNDALQARDDQDDEWDKDAQRNAGDRRGHRLAGAAADDAGIGGKPDVADGAERGAQLPGYEAGADDCWQQGE